MWVIAVLLLISFALVLFGKIAKTRGMNLGFFCLGMAVWSVGAWLLLAEKNDSAILVILSFPPTSGAIADLIARPIWRRRVIPPCVRVERLSQSGIAMTIVFLLFIAFFIYFLVTEESLHSFGMIIFFGLMTVPVIICLIQVRFEKIEICGNGVWQDGRLWPWAEYESFSWKRKTADSVELRLVSKSLSWTTQLMVPPEDRETVHQLLDAHLPDLNAKKVNSSR
jgi:hypothetical protein